MKTLQKILFLLALSLLPTMVFATEPNNVAGDIQLSVEKDGIHVNWSKATNFDGTDVSGYRVYVDTHSIPDAEMYADVQDTKSSATSYVVTKFKGEALKTGTTYYFALTAVNQTGEESLNYSKEASIAFTGTIELPSKTISPVQTAAAALLQVVSASATGKNTVEVIFNKVVILPQKIADAFTIQSEAGAILDITAMQVKEDGMTVVLTTADQSDLTKYTVTALSSIADSNKNPLVTGKMDTASFLGTSKETETLHGAGTTQEEVKDITPPEDVTGLKVKHSLTADKSAYDVILSWISSKNTAGDLDHQLYYEKTDAADYGTAIKIEKDKTSYQKVLEGGKRYTFKISTVDSNGNESTGAITSVILPETGPAALLGLAGLFSAGVTRFLRKKKD